MALLFAACKNESRPIVSGVFIDSLIRNYSDTSAINSIETDLQFWMSKIDPLNPGQVSELQYASMLLKRFHLKGDIEDLRISDSMLAAVDRTYAHKETGANMGLIRNCILQHRFKEADSLLQFVRNAGIKKYESAAIGFDVAFELGHYRLAETALKKIADPNDYGYHFRRAKLAHYNGDLETAIAAMRQAASLAQNSIALKQAALSNQADLYLHKGDLQEAYDLYRSSIQLNATDLHSLMGIGWIALMHDKNDRIAEKIFLFVDGKTKAPDVLYKLVQVAAARGDSTMQQKYAEAFASIVTQPVYGNMYNKYLLELYTGLLQQPAKAEALAAHELKNRSTPQTHAWYVWSLHSNNKNAEAARIYAEHVSGKPLEGQELYWMGKYMQALEKGFNAQQYFKAAFKNRYDLGVGMVADLENAVD